MRDIRKSVGEAFFPHQGGLMKRRTHGQPVNSPIGQLFITSEWANVTGRRFSVRTYDSNDNTVGTLGIEHAFLTHRGAMDALSAAQNSKPARLSGQKRKSMKDPKDKKNEDGQPATDESASTTAAEGTNEATSESPASEAAPEGGSQQAEGSNPGEGE